MKEHYFDRVDEKEVTITGLPCEGGNLATPIWVQTETGDRKFGFSYTGGRPPSQYLPSNKVLDVTVRFGTCAYRGGRSWDCTKPDWMDSKQVVKVDTVADAPVLALATPQFTCS